MSANRTPGELGMLRLDESKMRTFLVSYNHEGSQWVAELKAASVEDARARLKRLAYGSVDGELMFSVPAAPGIGGLLRVVVGIRNWWRAR